MEEVQYHAIFTEILLCEANRDVLTFDPSLFLHVFTLMLTSLECSPKLSAEAFRLVQDRSATQISRVVVDRLDC